GRNLGSVSLDRQQSAGFDSLAIYQHRAGAADRGFTSDMSAGKSCQITNEMNQQQTRLDIGLLLVAINGESDFHAPPPIRLNAGAKRCVLHTPVAFRPMLEWLNT